MGECGIKTAIAVSVVHWTAVAVWGFWGWIGFWAVCSAVLLVAARVKRR